jgi:double zinc ribbon protein
MTLALFGIQNDGLNLAVNLLVFFLFVIWLALVYWTYADASRRIEDPMLIACATAASLFPYIGTIVYTIVRPPEYLEDAHERELEIRAAESRVQLLQNRTCAGCGHEIEGNYLRCPHCMKKLKEPCRSCGKPIDPAWRVCPFCEAEIVSRTSPPPSRSGRRSRRPTASERAAERAAERSERTGSSSPIVLDPEPIDPDASFLDEPDEPPPDRRRNNF